MVIFAKLTPKYEAKLNELIESLSPCHILDSLEPCTGCNTLFQLFLVFFGGQMAIFSKLTPYYEARTG